MVQLSLMETLRDKASKLLPTPYMDAVVECTAPQLSTPSAEHVRFLCDSVNTKPEAVDEVVRAVRRRLDDEDAAVRQLTLLLLQALVRHGGNALHVEVASQKGLLRDVVNLAVALPTSARGMRTREAALALVLNLSIWFASYPDARCSILTTLADDVRTAAGAHVFDGTTPDVHVQLHMANTTAAETTPHDSARQPPHALRRPPHGLAAFTSPMLEPQSSSGSHAAMPPPLPPQQLLSHSAMTVVTAVPINLPTEETITSMLDTCIALNEYLGNMDKDSEGNATADEVVVEFDRKVRHDHEYVTMLLSSDLDVNRDLLRSISESQSSVLRSVAALRRTQPRFADPSAHTTTTTQHAPAVPAAAPAAPAAAAAAAPAAAPPSVDDIFGPPVTATTAAAEHDDKSGTVAAAAAHSHAHAHADATTTSPTTAAPDATAAHEEAATSDTPTTTTTAAAAAAPVVPASTTAETAHDDTTATTTAAATETTAAAQDAAAAAAEHEKAVVEEALDERAYAAREAQEQQEKREHDTAVSADTAQGDDKDGKAAAAAVADAEDATASATREQREAAAADAHGNASDDDDFDAFINKHATQQ